MTKIEIGYIGISKQSPWQLNLLIVGVLHWRSFDIEDLGFNFKKDYEKQLFYIFRKKQYELSKRKKSLKELKLCNESKIIEEILD